MTNTDRIRELERESATLVSRVASLNVNIDRSEERIGDTNRSIQDIDKRLALLIVKVEGFEERLNEFSARRWDILKIVMTAAVGAALAVAGFFAKGEIDRRTNLEPAGRPHAASDRK